MSFDVSTLTRYVDQEKMALIKRSVLGGRTLKYITVQPGIKSTATINIINSDLVAQLGACGWNPEGTTQLTQETLSVCPLAVTEALCLQTLEEYYLQKLMQPGSYNQQIPFEQIFAQEKADKINALIDDLVWKGDTDGGSGNLGLCDGFIYKAENDWSSKVVRGNVDSVTAFTPSNAISVVDGMASVVPADILGLSDLTLFMGYDNYRLYATALRNANYFHYNGQENQGEDYSQMIPGTSIKMVAVRGLNGTGKMFLTSAANLYFGTDLLNDSESFEIFYSKDYDEVRFRAKWKGGVGSAFPDFIVYFSLY